MQDAMSFYDQQGVSQQPPAVSQQLGTLRLEDSDAEAVARATKQAFVSVVRSRADLGGHAFITGPIVFGRDPNCSFPLHDLRVSWRHATITPDGSDGYQLIDLRSTNGTLVNGIPVDGPRTLHDGDKIFVGETVIRFSLADEMDIDFHNEVAALVGTDPLTGLPSKRRFDDELEFALQTAIKSGGTLAMLMMDMDGVKQINDSHGHLFGAHVIGETGRLIALVLGGKGRACRFGGDEFSAFLPAHDVTSASAIAEQIRHAVETAEMEKDGIPLHPTISIGVACYPDVGHDPLTLVSMADAALYRAKHQGRNRVAS
jgi:diguanylate cyclase (GGDEF)-like protein